MGYMYTIPHAMHACVKNHTLCWNIHIIYKITKPDHSILNHVPLATLKLREL